MRINELYAGAINSSNLKSEERTTYSDTDVLAAYGLAAIESPLAVALERLLIGDSRAVGNVVDKLCAMVLARGRPQRLNIVEAEDIAKSCLAWYRHGACKPCSGRGRLVIPDTTTLDEECPACLGAGKINFEAQFTADKVDLARWLLNKLERQLSVAGPKAMEKIGRGMLNL